MQEVKAAIGIDIGGTFTDCIAFLGDRVAMGKTATTGYDLNVGLTLAMEQAARKLGMSLADLLPKVNDFRYSTTLVTNQLIQKQGPKLGLIVTAGHEQLVTIGRARRWADGLHISQRRYSAFAQKALPLIPPDMTVGIRERIDCNGQIVIPLDKDEIRKQVHYLLDRGAESIVVCLLWSFLNPVHEKLVKEVILEEYPPHYLGKVPVWLSSEVHPKWHEYPRANVTILSAYVSTEVVNQLLRLSGTLKDLGYKKPLVLVNNVGGCAKTSRTKAVETYAGGPVAGLVGAAYLSRLIGAPKVLATDMGGTSFDFGLLVNSSPVFYEDWPVIETWATENAMIEVKSIGAGGGSIAWFNPAMGNRLEVGPQSAGSNPGPACYPKGGTEPTVTDANVVLGYLNPKYFAGGTIQLSREKAIQALEKVSRPLGMSVEEAAAAIRQIIDTNMSDILKKELALRGLLARDFVLFAYGGAGPTHCIGYGSQLGIQKIITSPYSSCFCAMGGVNADLRHSYEASRHIVISTRGNEYSVDYDSFNSMVKALAERAVKDLRVEGFHREDVQYTLEVDMRYAGVYVWVKVRSPSIHLRSQQEVKALLESFYKVYASRYSTLALVPNMDVSVENFYLTATVTLPPVQLPTFESAGVDPKQALRATRPVYWSDYRSFRDTPVFDSNLIRPGNVIHGPGIVEAENTTIVITPGMKYSVDRYLNGIIESEQTCSGRQDQSVRAQAAEDTKAVVP